MIFCTMELILARCAQFRPKLRCFIINVSMNFFLFFLYLFLFFFFFFTFGTVRSFGVPWGCSSDLPWPPFSIICFVSGCDVCSSGWRIKTFLPVCRYNIWSNYRIQGHEGQGEAVGTKLRSQVTLAFVRANLKPIQAPAEVFRPKVCCYECLGYFLYW